jgi:hypothetical protein
MEQPNYDSWIQGEYPDGEIDIVDVNEMQYNRQVSRDVDSSDWN